VSDLDEIVAGETRAAVMQVAQRYTELPVEGFMPKLAAAWHCLALSESEAQYVYFIQAGEGGPLKVGIAFDVNARLRSLQTASPFDLRLLGSVPGARRAEEALHHIFAPHRLRGEWFSPHPVLLGVVNDLIATHQRYLAAQP
jgi:Meiotically Up-regulated Gene 113 (MUG113) protein